MQLPIAAYGHSILRRRCEMLDAGYPGYEKLIDDVWETMQHASGCGLAASQVGHALRLFIVDSKTTYNTLNEPDRKDYFAAGDQGIMETFINATILERSEDWWEDEEGCLSIPGLTGKVKRPWTITMAYYNREFEKQVRTFSGATARMIQHEYDHTEGILYLDHLRPLTRKLLKNKLRKIAAGQVSAGYPMRYK